MKINVEVFGEILSQRWVMGTKTLKLYSDRHTDHNIIVCIPLPFVLNFKLTKSVYCLVNNIIIHLANE